VTRSFTAIVHREGDGFVALGPELDVVSQGASFEDARANLVESRYAVGAVTSECSEFKEGQSMTVPIPDHHELALGTLSAIIRQSGIPWREFKSH